MKNRAKCKLCNSIIESFHASDYVLCKCGHIAVHGGDAMKCIARDWANFIRVDDEGNEIIPKIVDKDSDVNPLDIDTKPTKKELLDMLERDIKNMENPPQGAMLTPITHYDFCSSLMLLLAILKAEDSA